ncbi:MAG: FHA domain-containing protein [Ectothiorhodospiraceae bacterium]|nr:FHA domain-containing protein [Ectothiorhodospiraceae bacterium]
MFRAPMQSAERMPPGGGGPQAGADARSQPSTDGPDLERLAQRLLRLERGMDAMAAGLITADELLRSLGARFFPVEGGWRRLATTYIDHPDTQVDLKRQMLEEFLRRARAMLAGNLSGREFDATSTMLAPSTGAEVAHQLERLPIGVSVRVRATAGETIVLRLATLTVRLRMAEFPMLVLEDGRTHVLGQGRTYLGRSPTNDIVIDARHADVSRHHLIIERSGERMVLTDLSSQGTFVSDGVILAS